MKAITFLGATQAWETTYVMPDGSTQTAPFFGVALARFYPDLSMKVLVTEKASQMHLARFQDLVEDHVAELDPVPIPDGANESELWTLFQTVVDCVDDGEEVIFDITHGFRSLPFLSLLAVAYLRTVKQIHLQAVLYGNFEARDQSTTPHRAPVIDLTDFVALFDWMTAADRFIRFGDAQDLARQLSLTKPDYRTATKAEMSEWTSSVGRTASALTDVSQSLRLLRPQDAMSGSAFLRERLLEATGLTTAHARPFQVISRRVIEAFSPLALDASQDGANPVPELAIERELVHWYLQRNQSVQAAAVAREWIVTWAMVHIGQSDVLDRDARTGVEKMLGHLVQEQIQGALEPALKSSRLGSVPAMEQAIDLFNQLGNLRNDIMHAGKRKGALPARQLDRKVRDLCAQLDALPLPA